MKIGILTFHASHNYGSMLQAYALQTVLHSMGHESKIINLRTDMQKSLIQPEIDWNSPRATISRCIKHPFRTISLTRKFNRFELFMNQHLQCSRELHSHDEVMNYIQESSIDTVIVGSDQIWNTACWDFDTSYLLDFELPIRRIAYAPSLGSTPEKLAKDKRVLLCESWLRFDTLSTREQRGSNFIKMLTGRDCAVVLDPTLLLDKKEYKRLCNAKPIVSKQYIFYYTPREEPGTFCIAQLLATQKGFPIVVTQSHPDYVGDNVIRINDCGPREFLNIISNASYCVGNSFHLMAFSLIFHREFLMVSGCEDSRMMNILEPLGLSDRIITPDIRTIEIPAAIDYAQSQTVLQSLRTFSLEFIRCALR